MGACALDVLAPLIRVTIRFAMRLVPRSNSAVRLTWRLALVSLVE